MEWAGGVKHGVRIGHSMNDTVYASSYGHSRMKQVIAEVQVGGTVEVAARIVVADITITGLSGGADGKSRKV